jgi:hypothetical protein
MEVVNFLSLIISFSPLLTTQSSFFSLNHLVFCWGRSFLLRLPMHCSDWQMGRDASLWGADCGEFLPDRWIDEKGSIKQHGQYKFHAFNVRITTSDR